MKFKHLKLVSIITVIMVIAPLLSGCAHDCKKSEHSTIGNEPLNISIFIDLSDRLDRELTPSQMERDTAIIGNLTQIFINDCVKRGKIINSKNHFQIFFHPIPKSSEIATLAKNLNFDMASVPLPEKKQILAGMREKVVTNISQIYRNTLDAKSWPGSDIWAFFTDKKVDNQCIRQGYRNLLIILTDGYLFYVHNKRKEGKAYSYVLPQTISDPESSLIVGRDGLDNLEVLMLEVNPYEPIQRDKLIQVLEDWFKGMGVKHFVVSDTDLPVNTETIIRNFIESPN